MNNIHNIGVLRVCRNDSNEFNFTVNGWGNALGAYIRFRSRLFESRNIYLKINKHPSRGVRFRR